MAGVDFAILEAADAIAGRLAKNDTFADCSLDLGASWLHGHCSILGDLAEKRGEPFSRDRSGERYRFRN